MKTIPHLRQILLLAALCSHSLLLSQNPGANEIQTPELSPFSLGQGGLQGAIANSVQEVTGKVNISLPIATLKSRALSYPVTLSYNGGAVFKQAQYLNQFSTQSTLGVGWGLQHPKIVADPKGTAARDDDTFYLVDGGSTTRLICTKRQPTIPYPESGQEYLDFEMEQYKPYKIRYEMSETGLFTDVYTTRDRDWWTITDDKGTTYTYGRTDNARENVLAWGNWIGDSKNPNGATPHTIAWNLSKIEDQWGNTITLTYEEVNHKINSSYFRTHTSASYLKEIGSSAGGRIVFTYGEKNADEYYEPHKEQSEPDAYQERFETKYLETITTYDNADQEVYTYTMAYEMVKKANSDDQNRYLQSITQTDNQGNSLPPVAFAYHTSGSFEGGLKQVTYPSGGSVSYTYSEQSIFDATDPPIEVEGYQIPGYDAIGYYTGNDYALKVMKKGGWHNGRHDYQMKVEYDWWTGQGWKRHEFVFLDLVTVSQKNRSSENLKFTAGKDFFAFLIFDKSTDKGSLHLIYKLSSDGISWGHKTYENLPLQSNNNYNNDSPRKDPVLMSGENFVAIGENQSDHGRLYRFVWSGNTWSSHTLYQGKGTYYYGAANNFIIALEEDGGNDLVTGVDHADLYYMHYLDAAKQWQTKSWSSKVDHTYTYVAGTEKPSYLYPSNSMAGFMAHDNPEYILRWDTDYDLIAVDDILGRHEDHYPLLPIMNNTFGLFSIHSFTGSMSNITKLVVFDGLSWHQQPTDDAYHGPVVGDNTILMTKENVGAAGRPPSHRFQSYLYQGDLNTHQWSFGPIGSRSTITAKGFGQGFFIVGNYGYKVENTGAITSFGQISNHEGYSRRVVRNNLSGVYHESTFPSPYGSYFYLNKKDGLLHEVTFYPYHDRRYTNNYVPQLGPSKKSYMSPNIFYLKGDNFKRLVEAAPNQEVKNSVVSSIAIDNGAGEVRHIAYTYNNAHTLPDDESTFYGEVTIQNKGYGDGNIGKTKKYFNTGKEDVRLAGLPTKTIVEDKDGNKVSENETVWKKSIRAFSNRANTFVGMGYHVRPKKTTEKLIFEGQEVITETQNTYNTLGLLTQTSRNNSDGETETTYTQYAYENDAAVKSKNMLAFPYQTKTEINGEEVAVERSTWTSEDEKAVYAYQNQSGVTQNTLRLNSEITKVDNRGNIMESHNGQGLYKTILYGYNDLYPIATITNAKYDEVMDALTVSYAQLQNLDNTALEAQLTRLYDQLPQAMVTIDLYDTQGRAVRSLDARGESVNFSYDAFGRPAYTTDANAKVLEKVEYHYGSQY